MFIQICVYLTTSSPMGNTNSFLITEFDFVGSLRVLRLLLECRPFCPRNVEDR